MNKHYEFIDALRGMAILGVVAAHVSLFTVNPVTNIIYRLAGEGQRGVQLFYVVSALTLFLSLSASSFTGQTSEKIKYFLRRFFRIAPLFYLLLCIVLFFTFIEPISFFSYVNKDTLNFVSSFSFTNGFFPTYLNNIIVGQWSIAIEVLFYLFVPFLFLMIKDLASAKKFFLYSLLFASFVEFLLPTIYPRISDDAKWYMFTSLPMQLPTFALGFVSYFLIYDTREKKLRVNKKIAIGTIRYLFFATIVVEAVFFLARFLTAKIMDTSVATPRTYVESIILVCLVVLLANGYISILKNKLFQFFGKISYSLYLSHFAILGIIRKTPFYTAIANHVNVYIEYIFLLCVGLLASSAFSYIMYRYIETQGINFGKYLSKNVLKL